MQLKRCSDCGNDKPLASFSLVKKSTGQRRPECNQCKLAREKRQIAQRRLNDGPKPDTRCCSKCSVEKPLDSKHFKSRVSSPHGLTTECKQCLGARNLAWSKTEAGIAVRKRNEPKYTEQRKEYAKQYAFKNRLRINKYVQEWRYKNIDHVRQLGAAWARKNKAKRTEYRHKRRAAGEFSYSIVPELMRLQKGKCVTCRGLLTKFVEVDHILPIALGGTNERSNLQLLCRSCNRSKGAKDPIDFMQLRGFLL